MATLAEQRIAELDTEFGVEEIDVLDGYSEEPILRLHVLWEAPTGMINLHILAARDRESGSLAMIDCLSPNACMTYAPVGLASWVEGDRKVWERCQAEWERYLEQREP